MKLYLSDLYRVEINYPLDEVQNDILYYCYQPIIGGQALQLYMMLSVEGKRMNRFLKPSSLSRLTSFISMNLQDLEKAFQTLEGIGLLKTFVYYENDLTQYVYQLQSPLTLQAFFKNQILSSLLQESLSQEDFERTVQYFEASHEDISQYEEVTAGFTDVFEIRVQRGKKPLKLKEMKEKQSQNITLNYDMDLFYKSLADYQVNRSKLTSEDIQFLIQLANVYAIDAFTLAGFVKDAMETKGLNRQLCKTKLKNYYEADSASKLKEVYYKQPIQYKTQQNDQSTLALHMQYLDNISPYDLLKEKQGGAEPVYHDLTIIETLMMQLGLKPAVVNVLIEYVLGKNQNRLSKRYCEAIGASFARKHVETAMDAYHALMNHGEEDEVKVEQVLEKEVDDSILDELPGLFQQLKEGQL